MQRDRWRMKPDSRRLRAATRDKASPATVTRRRFDRTDQRQRMGRSAKLTPRSADVAAGARCDRASFRPAAGAAGSTDRRRRRAATRQREHWRWRFGRTDLGLVADIRRGNRRWGLDECELIARRVMRRCDGSGAENDDSQRAQTNRRLEPKLQSSRQCPTVAVSFRPHCFQTWFVFTAFNEARPHVDRITLTFIKARMRATAATRRNAQLIAGDHRRSVRALELFCSDGTAAGDLDLSPQAQPHGEEARSAVSNHPPELCVALILRDARLRRAPQIEDSVPLERPYRCNQSISRSRTRASCRR